MKLEDALSKIVELNDKIQNLETENSQYKEQINTLNNTITNNQNKYNSEKNDLNERITNLQNINQNYFNRLIVQDEKINNDNNSKDDLDTGLSFEDFINKL